MSKFQSEFLLTDEQVLGMGIKESEIEQFRRKHYQDSFSIQSWYELLKQHTFPTISVELTFSEGDSMMKYNRLLTCHGSTNVKLDDVDKKNRKSVETKLDTVLKNMPHGAFVKLNTRSPKDVPHQSCDDSVALEILDKEICKEGLITNLTPNQIVSAYIRTMNLLMKVTSGPQAFDLLVKSYRVYEDLSKNVSFGEKHFKSKIEIREWIPEIVEHPDMEFRCFVHDKKLNACSQYFCDIRSDELVKNKNEIADRLLKFFDEIKNSIPHSHFVIDFFVGKNQVYIIELNPFHIGAGACLFSWKTDRYLFMNGPFEFRVKENEFDKQDYKKILSIGWEKQLIRKYGFEIPGHNALKKEIRDREEEGIPMTWIVVGSVVLGLVGHFIHQWYRSRLDS